MIVGQLVSNLELSAFGSCVTNKTDRGANTRGVVGFNCPDRGLITL